MRNHFLKNISFIIFATVCFHDGLNAQNWISYSEVNGLSNNKITAIVEDSHNKIWVGTSEGLNRFDGRDWVYFAKAKGDPLIDDVITDLLLGSAGNLWIATREGFSTINTEDDLDNPENWKSYNRANTHGGFVGDDITSLLEDETGNIWIGVWKKGISILRPVSAQNPDPVTNPDNWTTVKSDSQLLSLRVFALAQDGLGTIWVATFAGVSRYDPNRHELTGRWDLFPELGDVKSIFADSHGYIWFGRTGRGVARVLAENPDERDEFSFARDADNIGEDSDGKLWFGTVDRLFGIFVVDPKSNLTDSNNWFEFKQEDGLAANTISSILQDSDGDMWIGTAGEGISKYDISWLNFSKGFNLDFRSVITIEEDDAQNIWFGTENDGLRIVNLNANLLIDKNWLPIRKKEKALASNRIREIFKDNTGFFWIGTADIQEDPNFGGLNFVNPLSDLSNTVNWLRFKVPETGSGLIDNNVNAITQDQAQYLWFGTNKGLSRVHRDSTGFSAWRTFDISNGLNDNTINSLFFDDNQNILWVGTAEGLNRKDLAGDLSAEWEEVERLKGIKILTIFKDIGGRLWFGSSGDGVYRINSGADPQDRSNWSKFTTADGLASNTVQAMVQQRPDEYWFATSSGLTRLRVSETAGQIDSVWTTFSPDDEDGPQALNIRSAFKDSKGDLWFGTIGKGVTRHRIKANAPDTFIEPKLDVLTADNIILNFHGADLNTPAQKLKFSYQLDNTGWHPFDPSKSVQLNNIDFGRHVFEVRAVDSDGNIDPTPDRDVFYRINPVFGGKVLFRDSTATVSLQFAPGELKADKPQDSRSVIVSPVPSYELADDEVLFAYDLKPTPRRFQLTKPATLSFGLLNSPEMDTEQLAIFRLESTPIGIGGTVQVAKDSVAITTAIEEFGRYGVRSERVTEVPDQPNLMTVQPRVISPKSSGKGFGSVATVSFTLENESSVTVKVYDVGGRLVKKLLQSAQLFPGVNSIEWNGTDEDEQPCRSGLYIVLMEINGKPETKTVLVSNSF